MRKLTLLGSSIFALKFVLAALTPLGYDFIQYMAMVASGDNVVAWLSWSPWVMLTHYIYTVWLAIPVDHGDFMAAITTNPNALIPSHYLLTALVKAPLILADAVSTILVYRLGVRLSGSNSLGEKAATFWLTNPFTTLFVEMWGSIDILLIALTLVGIELAVRSRDRLSATALASAILLRISPVVTAAALAVWCKRMNPARKRWLLFVVGALLGMAGYVYWITQGNVVNLIDLLHNPPYYSVYIAVTFRLLEYRIIESNLGGFAVITVTLYYLVAAHIWPKTDQAIISLTLCGYLLLYGFAEWLPPAFLWAVPFITLWSLIAHEKRFAATFHALLALYIVLLYGPTLLTNGSSILFVPVQWQSSYGLLSQTVETVWGGAGAAALPYLESVMRAIMAGFCVAYAASVTYASLTQGVT